jgi:RNA polymerase sigma factor (sigma-70 family)
MDRDIKIVRKVLSGDPRCFEELVLKYQGNVIRTCYKFVRNEQDARDIAQEVFIKIYNNLSCYKEHSKFSTWIYRITVNTCLNYLRKKDLLNISFCDDFKAESLKKPSYDSLNAGCCQNPEDIIVAKEVKMVFFLLPRQKAWKEIL